MNLTDASNANKTATLMLFYVDWCPYCKTAKPEWESLKSSSAILSLMIFESPNLDVV